MSTQILSVSEVNNYIKALMDSDIILPDVIVRGEISNFVLHYSGHMYLTLKDENSVIKAVMFKGANSKLKFNLENGMKIIAQGKVSVYERSGQYQLYMQDVQPDGLGALHVAFEQLKAKLQKEGLFDSTRKKNLPKYPKKIGVVTSSTGAAIRDILNILGRRYPYAEVNIYPVLVQGDQASYQISEGIDYFNRKESVDVIIIGRGGGSIEELWAYNEERLARKIAASNIPIVSAVGHETDFTISDFVSDYRAPTPSAAAEIVTPSRIELKDKINNINTSLYFLINHKIETNRKHLDNLKQSYMLKNPIDKISQYRVLLDDYIKYLIRNMEIALKNKKEQLSLLATNLDALSPLAVISRGYVVMRNIDKQIIKSIKGISIKDSVNITLIDGEVCCEIKDVIKKVTGGKDNGKN